MKRIAQFVVLLAFADIVPAQVFDPENVLIENVYLASETAGQDTINLLIRDNELVLVSEDRIPLPEGFTALDADKGFLVGKLLIGEPPDFIILSTDPREDMAALMDTRANSTYMVYRGELRKNTLQASEGAADDTSGHPVWHAYSPPPVALPTSHDPGAYWNHWSTENTNNVLFGVLALDRQEWPSQDSESEDQVGDLEELEGGEIRDIRLGIFGTLSFFERPWGYTISVATNSFNKEFEEGVLDNFRAIDYRVDIPVGESMKLTVGKQKEPISMERTMTLINLPMQERSAPIDTFLRSRNFGAQLSGTALDRRLSWAGGIFNDFIDEDLSVGDATTSVTGRVTWLPYLSDDESNLLHLAIGTRLSDGEQPVRYRAKPEFNKSPMFVDTGLFDADRIDQLSLEASWRHGPFWLAAEHLSTSTDSPTSGRLDFSGYFVMASWIITGEMRTYNQGNGTFGPVPIARPARGKGFGALEIAARWSGIDLDDGPITGGNMDILSFSTSWWLSATANLNINYRYIVNDRDGLSGETGGLNLRLLLKLN
jgi:phosphate-selective porin OprO/OprP